MRIGVNATSLNNSDPDTFLQLAQLLPEQTFLFFYDSESGAFNLTENIIPLVITPQATIPLKWKIWYNIKLPIALKKNKADVFISIVMGNDLSSVFQPACSSVLPA